MSEPAEPDAPGEQGADQDADEIQDAGTWATLTEAASSAGVSSKTIRRAVKAGTIDGHRSSDAPNSPWLVRLEDVEARWGAPAPDSDSAGTAAMPIGEPVTETVEVESDEPDVKAEIAGQPLRGRLGELRKRLVVEEPQRRWWQRRKR